MAEWDGNESSCACDCGFDIPKGGRLETLTLDDITGIANLIYPVGSIYMSLNTANPATLFGGTWERIEGKFLLAASDDHVPGSTGGETSHKHAAPVGYNSANKIMGISYAQGTQTSQVNASFAATSETVTTGSGSFSWTLPKTDSQSNMPPYLAVCVWQRTA